MSENNIKSIVRSMEEKLLSNNCDTCDCLGSCKQKELRESMEAKLKVLKKNKTVTK